MLLTEGWSCGSVGRVFASHTENSGFLAKHHIKQGSTWEIEAEGLNVQGHPQLHPTLRLFLAPQNML